MKRFMFNICLTAILSVMCITSAHALTITGGATSTYIFDMLINADGTVIDNGTIRVDGRWTKTELKNAFMPKDGTKYATDYIGFGNIAVFRMSNTPLYENDPYADSVWQIFFDSSGYSVYVYRFKDTIEKEEE